MPSTVAPPSQVEQALARGWTILTANQRAARSLRRDFDLRQRDLGLDYWQPPPILAWDTWLSGLWRNLLLDGRASDLLLSSTQEHILWRELIDADEATSSLRPVDALAQGAADAWMPLHAYEGRSGLNKYDGNFDTQTFRRWAGKFESRCRDAHYLTQAKLPETLRAAGAAAHIGLPPGLLLVGFDSKTPAQTALLEAVRATGTLLGEFDLDSAASPPAERRQIAAAPGEFAELTACAHWLRMRLTQQPDARIAVIVPSIETARPEIDRVFRQVLAPELNDVAAPAASGPYEFSLGVPLATTPITATAFDLLHWATGPLSLDRVSVLLLSPYFAADSGSELLARAEFDAFVLRNRKLLQPQISLDNLADLISRPGLQILTNHLSALRPLFRKLDLAAERTHADWAATIHELLEAAGWAPPALLDSIEFQTRRKWESALDDLATLDFDSHRIRFTVALDRLKRIAAETLFAPESRHAPIQIMGPLESAGSTFDAIWFLHANDQAWPSRPSPNPLLPWQLQRELQMPGATPSLDADYARRITERIALSAPTVVFSYAQESADGPQRPSPALAELALEPCAAADIAFAEPDPAHVALESVKDDVPIPPPPDDVLQGGASILQAQAACGFRAFAEKRLFSSGPDTVELGLDASERGSLVHAVLDYFWEAVKNQANLTGMTTAERTAQLNECINRAFAKDYARPAAGWPQAYVAAERQRLLSLLLLWLEFECTRQPFEVKEREAELCDVHIDPLRLQIRVDRVDTNLSDGEPAGDIILDYKTGAATPKDWLSDRPDAPQLPLYTVVAKSKDLAAVAFASVRPGNLMGIVGYEAGGPGRSGILPKTAKLDASSLTEQVEKWHAVLTSLAEAFHAGDASVSPKHYPQTCQYCKQRLLCRLDLAALDADVLEETEEETDAFNPEENDFA